MQTGQQEEALTAVGFEPTHPKIVELESTALDHSAKLSADRIRKCSPIGIYRNDFVFVFSDATLADQRAAAQATGPRVTAIAAHRLQRGAALNVSSFAASAALRRAFYIIMPTL